MSQHYSDPTRETDPHALPNVEVFYANEGELYYRNDYGDCNYDEPGAEPNPAGWYYWYCLPGCMPDSEAEGPFETEEQAVEHAKESYSE